MAPSVAWEPCAAERPGPGPVAGPSTPAAEAWHADWALRSVPELEQLRRRARPPTEAPVMRSSQLDAGRLDDELGSMLREQFVRVFALFRPGIVAALQPELTLLLDYLIFRFSVGAGQPLPGMALMNLRHRSERGRQAQHATSGSSSGGSSNTSSGGTAAAPALAGGLGGRSGVEGPGLGLAQRRLYCLGAVVLRYGWTRLGNLAAARRWAGGEEETSGGDSSTGGGNSRASLAGGWASVMRRRGWDAMRAAESGYRLAALLNFLAFLRTGRYRSVLERLLGARLVYTAPSAARAISFEYLNRQLVWAELSELLLFLLPLVNAPAIRRAIRAALLRLPLLGGSGGGADGAGQHGKAGQLAAERACGVCGAAEPLAPYAARPCGHLFCYYCLRSQCGADAEYACPRCLARVEGMQRWAPGPPPLRLA